MEELYVTMKRAAKMELEAIVFKSCTFYISQKQNRDRMRKKVKRTKNKKNVKNDGKMGVVEDRPPSGRKQSIWRGYETGLYEVILVLNQK